MHRVRSPMRGTGSTHRVRSPVKATDDWSRPRTVKQFPADVERGEGAPNTGVLWTKPATVEDAWDASAKDFADSLWEKDFEERLVLTGTRPHGSPWASHLYYENDRRSHSKVVNLGTLQRMSIYQLQKELMDEVKFIKEHRGVDGVRMRRVRELMAYYTQACKDYDYMIEKAAAKLDDPFRITTDTQLGRILISDAGIFSRHSYEGKAPRLNLGVDADDYGDWNLLPAPLRRHHIGQREYLAKRGRLWAALFVGVALIAPMLIMVLHSTLVTTLVTSSVATLLFALLVALGSGWEDDKVVSAVAAYAAVMVVFVGTHG